MFGVGASNNFYLDKCVLVISPGDTTDMLTEMYGPGCDHWRVIFLEKKTDWRIFSQYANTARVRDGPADLTGTCLCLTRSWGGLKFWTRVPSPLQAGC